MRRLMLLLFPVLVALAGCGGGDRGSEATPAGETAADSSAGGHGDTGLTGMVSEEQFKALHHLKEGEAPVLRGEMIGLEGTRAYLSLPPQGEPPLPAVVVVHEWWGLNDNVKHWADRLAADGYAALAVDLYGGKVAMTPDSAMAYMKEVDPEASMKILLAGEQFLREDDRIRAEKRGVIGWCFGGGWALQTALHDPELDAAVMYYGGLVTDPAELKQIHAAVLGVFGNKDQSIPPEKVTEFDRALTEAGVTHEIYRYDAPHAFANPSNAIYDEKAAADAWKHVRAFLAEYLKGGPEGR